MNTPKKPIGSKPAPRADAPAGPRLIVRRMQKKDIPAVQALQRRVYGGMEPWTNEQVESQLRRFPEGQLCVVLDGKLVATSSSLIVSESDFDGWHNYDQASGHSTIENHDPDGDTLYGIDIAVDPAVRGMRLARRIYEARKEVAIRKNLRAILIAGRIPNYHRHASKLSPEEYVRKVVKKELKDPVLTAQLANGFAIRGVLRGYLESDRESCGNAVFMEWLNPNRHPEHGPLLVSHLRVAAVQLQMRVIGSFEEFVQQCHFFVDTCAEYRMDFVLFPEMFTNQLQALVPAARPGLTARRLHEFTDRFVESFTQLAIRFNVNIIGGTHLTVEDGRLYNVAYLFRRDGSVDRQFKLHNSPSEQRWWGTTAGDSLRVMDTDRGKIAILVGNDVEFPEVARLAAARGVDVLFVPFDSDVEANYQRVRMCAQARCIENDVYAVLAGPVGNLPFVEGADVHYGQACILTPAGLPFARNGVADEATPNVETMLVHELDLEVLRRSRKAGYTRTWPDRRRDLYGVRWTEAGVTKEV